MDNNNWRPNHSNEANMDTSSWRGGLQQESRQRIVNKIMDTLKRHIPVSGQEGLHELQKIAQRFEEKMFTAATSQSDYLRKISLKMLTMETKSQGSMANAPNQVRVLDVQTKTLRGKDIRTVKVLWDETTQKMTWELEEVMKKEYPCLFDDVADGAEAG
ncbi:mediator of RNA polymerase II transcription subunit 15a isoform X2 [Vigna angularis]|uniref:mediator of RNA polymerase II transcription subunit 15a isoform X2 n=1 Tax=Phaseolus angularis TaxID=3914 RepID=UPI00080A14C1|nr:mediator of RNA polymerase II transcription subunit 15a isoform X2 [Vigna angularis]